MEKGLINASNHIKSKGFCVIRVAMINYIIFDCKRPHSFPQLEKKRNLWTAKREHQNRLPVLRFNYSVTSTSWWNNIYRCQIKFPLNDLIKLEEQLNQTRWVVPVLPDGELIKCLRAAVRLATHSKSSCEMKIINYSLWSFV